ncbi:DUF167 domain-containing protein [Dictyobacter formicarum]|uniref:UPF0235 protein KSZ_74890 n=1 Tax=Dictyobacter formicarum TaxID=2778368 RepID=A0ABQ3VV96_9CHLR|nr:DUF167 domain-containing protein [Dictyobacter formicarum]GHO89483.1 hypothetical protein KSZ_74890 [Dictyobacter formicarum]
MLVSVRVIPRSTRNQLEWNGEVLKARLTAPPVDGAANEALVALLANRLALPRRAISIVRGATSRQKVVNIEQLTPEELKQKLAQV